MTLTDVYNAIVTGNGTLQKIFYCVGIIAILFVVDHLIKKGDLL